MGRSREIITRKMGFPELCWQYRRETRVTEVPKEHCITVFILSEDVVTSAHGKYWDRLQIHMCTYCGYGKNRDGGIFEHPVVGNKFEAGKLSDSHDKPLPGKDEPTPHVLIGDKAFPLKGFYT
jgi:hypothetical protein